MDPLALEVGCCNAARVPLAVGDVLGDALVRLGRVVVRLALGQDGSQVCLTENQHTIEELAAKGAGLLHSPFAGRVGCDAAEVHPASAMLDEHQDVQPSQQHDIDMQEVDRDDPDGLDMEELPPRRARAARCRMNARSTQNLPHRGRRDSHAQFRQLAMDPAVSPQRVLLRQANDEACDTSDCRRAARLTPLLVSYFFAASLRCQASSVAGVTGKTPVQRLRGMSRVSAANQARSAGSYRIRLVWRRSTAFSCRSTSSSASVARSARNTRTARPSTQRVSK